MMNFLYLLIEEEVDKVGFSKIIDNIEYEYALWEISDCASSK
jgi:hypothetical protein